MTIYPVIMCGGSGTRLWPVSTSRTPKQFVDLLSGESLFRQTVRRVAKADDGLSLADPVITGVVPTSFVGIVVAPSVLLPPPPILLAGLYHYRSSVSTAASSASAVDAAAALLAHPVQR